MHGVAVMMEECTSIDPPVLIDLFGHAPLENGSALPAKQAGHIEGQANEFLARIFQGELLPDHSVESPPADQDPSSVRDHVTDPFGLEPLEKVRVASVTVNGW
jgi:hypothetical protein